jgi:hypothetical protein
VSESRAANAAQPAPAAEASDAAQLTAEDGDFLEYLATLETDDEDWTWFEDDRSMSDAKAAAKPESKTP